MGPWALVEMGPDDGTLRDRVSVAVPSAAGCHQTHGVIHSDGHRPGSPYRNGHVLRRGVCPDCRVTSDTIRLLPREYLICFHGLPHNIASKTFFGKGSGPLAPEPTHHMVELSTNSSRHPQDSGLGQLRHGHCRTVPCSLEAASPQSQVPDG